MKIKSPFLSYMRGKLGDSVVGSAWKGRNYLRAYVIPANPNTTGQQGQRQKNTLAMALFQVWPGSIAAAKTILNNLALPRQIAGVNLHMMIALSTQINATLDGNDIDVLYTVQHDVNVLGLYGSKDDATVTELVAKGDLQAGEDAEYVHEAPAAGVWTYYIGYADVFAGLDGAEKDAVRCAHWDSSTTPGTATPATATKA